MGTWKFSFPINGLHDVIKQDSNIDIDGVIFHYRTRNERVGTVTAEGNTEQMAEWESKYLINRSLGKICFAFNTEASISPGGLYYIDLINNPNVETITSSLEVRYSYVKETPEIVLAKMYSIRSDKQDTLGLALAYYKLGEYKNPLRIESFFSSMTVLVRDIWKDEFTKSDNIPTKDLKEKIRLVLSKRNASTFDVITFYRQWNDCYADERCSIAHGRGSKLVDPRTILEYNKIVNTVHYWARELIYYYIDTFQNQSYPG